MRCCQRISCWPWSRKSQERNELGEDLIKTGFKGKKTMERESEMSRNSASSRVGYSPPDNEEAEDFLECVLHLPSACCQDNPDDDHFSEHVCYQGDLQVSSDSSDAANATWMACHANLAGGVLSLVDKSGFASEGNNVFDMQIPIESCSLNVIDDSKGQFSLIWSKKSSSGSSFERSICFEVQPKSCYPSWVLALEDAIKVCHVKVLERIVMGDKSVNESSCNNAIMWYRLLYNAYEKAMNTIEFGATFVLHYNKAATGYTKLRVWLQAEEDDNSLMFFLAGVEGSPINSQSNRKKSMSNADLPNTVDGETAAKIDGLEVPFHSIVNVSKGTKENINRTYSNSSFFTISCSGNVFLLEADTRNRRDLWAQAISDVVNFCHVPSPAILRSRAYNKRL